jgi:hypothetical protein
MGDADAPTKLEETDVPSVVPAIKEEDEQLDDVRPTKARRSKRARKASK